MSVKHIGGGAVDGLVNGGLVVLGQVAARKIRGAAQGVLPATTNVSSGMAGVVTSLVAAVGVSIATHFVPKRLLSTARAAHVVAGAFSEAWNQGIAQTPLAPYMSAFPRPTVVRIARPNLNGVRGYVQAPRTAAMSGYVRLPVATTGMTS